ncbi:AmmeMemoRadiSam system protein B [candidate division KSB1 bacterium]|nr:AmmeMemoRadiSam system protein B [candidate division KSB1 bacterium]RQW10461.1 MAG: AmmeMemoRadiSam system protein B [candidate division KSB1 bacterium]
MRIRHAAWADQFYPGTPEELRATISSYLQVEKHAFAARIIGIISPHAGYAYSGRTAAVAYRQIEGESYETVVLLAPSHGAYIEGVSAYHGDYYETPLGDVPVDVAAVQRLAAAAGNVHVGQKGHESQTDRAEHSLEVQLPFLQIVLDDFSIVPLVFHDYSWDNCQRLGDAIASTFAAATTLLVASSDLYHGQSYEECRRMDEATLASVENDSPEQFCRNAARQAVMACGAGPITVLKRVAEEWGASQPRVLARTNSADVTGVQRGYVVGYAAAVSVMLK